MAKKRPACTYRMDPENIAALDQERLRRIASGVPRSQADYSDLVNEAVRVAFADKAEAKK